MGDIRNGPAALHAHSNGAVMLLTPRLARVEVRYGGVVYDVIHALPYLWRRYARRRIAEDGDPDVKRATFLQRYQLAIGFAFLFGTGASLHTSFAGAGER